MKRAALLLCLLLVCAAVFVFPASAESAASRVEAYCTVNTDGDCLVSMTVNLHMEAPDTGLSFPLPYSASDITMNGSSVPTSRVGSVTLASVGRVTGGMVGDFPIRFDYKLPAAVKVNANRELQLDIPLLCGFDYPINSLSFIITLPDSFNAHPLFTSTYQQNGFESNLDLVINGNMITGSTKNILNDHEAVNMSMVVPRDMFPSVSTYQREGNPELIPMGICAGLALVYWLLFLRTLPPQRQRATQPPAGIAAGELDCRVTMTGGDLTMLVLSWAQMGYLLIHLDGNGRVLLHKRMDMGNERSLFEVRVFQSLFGNRRVVDCSGAAYAKLIAKTSRMLPGEKTMVKPHSGSRKAFRILFCILQLFCGICVAMNMTSMTVLQILFSVIFGVLGIFSAWQLQEFAYFVHGRRKSRLWFVLGWSLLWILLGLIAHQVWIPLGSILVQIGAGYLAAYGGMRTELNRSEAGEIISLRRYLKKLPRPEAARLIKTDSEYFFRMAPYAIALGVGRPFAAAFGRRKLDQCPYIVSKVHGKRTADEWMNMMLQSVMVMEARYHRMEMEKWMAVRFR